MKYPYLFVLVFFISIQSRGQSPDCTINGFEIYADPGNEVVIDGSGDPQPCWLHENRVNLVILPDGYTSSGNDFEQYKAYKDAFLYQLFNNSSADPFPQYKNYFNIYWIWKASPEEGIGCQTATNPNPPPMYNCPNHACPPEEWFWMQCLDPSDTYFDFTRDHEDFHRFIRSDDSEAVLDYVQQDMFSNNTAPLTIAVLGNSLGTGEQHAGGGAEQYVNLTDVGIFCSTSRSSDTSYDQQNSTNLNVAGNTAVHELAHAFANLLDEYWFDVTTIGLTPEAANQTDDINNIPWEHWMDPDVQINQTINDVDVYEFVKCDEQDADWCSCTYNGNGTINTGVYKPTSGVCRMELSTTNLEFCPVCREQIIERIHGYVKPYDEDLATPDINDVHEASSTLVFDPAIIEPDPSYLVVNWYVNDVLVETIDAAGADAGETDYSWQFDCSDVNLDTEDPNTVRAEIFDVTGYDDTSNPSGPPYLADTRLVRKTSHTTDHKYDIEWTVNYNGEEADLSIRDIEDDTGYDEGSPWGYPFDPQVAWVAYDDGPDVGIYNDQLTAPYPADLTGEEFIEIAENPAYIYVRIKNRGCEKYESTNQGGALHLYTTKTGTQNSWNLTGPLPNYWTNQTDGYEITNTSGYTIPEIEGGALTVIEHSWTVQDLTPNNVIDFSGCVLARLAGITNDGLTEYPGSITDYCYKNNGVTMKNAEIVDMQNVQISEANGITMAPGGFLLVGNTDTTLQEYDLRLDVHDDEISDPITDQAEIYLSFVDSIWDISAQIHDSMLVGMVRIDSTRFLIDSVHAAITGINFPDTTRVIAHVGFAFLTEEVTDTLEYIYHLTQHQQNKEGGTTLGGVHYHIKRVTRNLFIADAGEDETILSGDTITLSADDIGEDAVYAWFDAAGDTLIVDDELSVWPTSNTTYTLEVVAEDDGYKDYDDVTVTVTNGLITNVAPNPASSTTTVYYETTGVSTVKIKVVDTSTMVEVDNFTVSAGEGTKVIDVSSYNSVTHIITLEGDSQDLDSATLIVQ